MKLVYKGAYNGNEDSLPQDKLYPDSKLIDGNSDNNKMLNILNIIAIVLDVFFLIIFCIISEKKFDTYGVVLGALSLVPHEFLHAICFKNEVYMYYWKEKMCMFVIGTESMSKIRFVFMSLLPNIVFGFVPFILYICNDSFTVLGSMGVITIGMGVGDYYNVINVLRKVPKGAKIYNYKFNTYYYMPVDI